MNLFGRLKSVTIFAGVLFGLIANSQENRLLVSFVDLTLTPVQSNAMAYLFEGTVQAERGKGNHNFTAAPVGEFLRVVVNQWGTLPEPMKKSLSEFPPGPMNPLRGWLGDNGFHPFLALAIESLIAKGDLPTRMAWGEALAAEPSLVGNGRVDPSRLTETFLESPYKVPTGFNATASPALGSIFGGVALEYLQVRALDLDSNGRPQVYDPIVASILSLNQEYKNLLLLSGKTVNSSVLGKVSEHFQVQSEIFNSLWNTADSIEVSAMDLQGALDTIRYKMAMGETDLQREITAFNQLLNQAIAVKTEFARAVEEYMKAAMRPGRGVPSIAQLENRLSPAMERLEAAQTRIKRFAVHAIDRMDFIWGFEAIADKKFALDTPWELRFSGDYERAKALGLNDKWEQIRTFDIIKEERTITHHWTTKEPVKDDKGRITGYRTVDHNSTDHETDYTTVQEPSKDRAFEKKVDGFTAEINELAGKSNAKSVTGELISRIEAFKREHALYALDRANGPDEFVHKKERIANQQARLNSLLTQLQLLEIQSARSLEICNRQHSLQPREKRQVLRDLIKLDQERYTRVKWTAGITGGVAGAAGICYFVLTSGILSGGGY